jgi:hypothetical protein
MSGDTERKKVKHFASLSRYMCIFYCIYCILYTVLGYTIFFSRTQFFSGRRGSHRTLVGQRCSKQYTLLILLLRSGLLRHIFDFERTFCALFKLVK